MASTNVSQDLNLLGEDDGSDRDHAVHLAAGHHLEDIDQQLRSSPVPTDTDTDDESEEEEEERSSPVPTDTDTDDESEEEEEEEEEEEDDESDIEVHLLDLDEDFDEDHDEVTLYQELFNLAEREASVNRGLDSSDPRSECTICLTEFCQGDRKRRLGCRHCFHVACIDTWLRSNPTCPVCRFQVNAQ